MEVKCNDEFKVNGIYTIDKSINLVTEKDFKEFVDKFDKHFIYIYGSTEMFYSVGLPLYLEEEVLKYWKDKGFNRFSNLTLNFDK
jgi:coproporphyrinogen III oxidase-like Fe-S oxidoreductase